MKAVITVLIGIIILMLGAIYYQLKKPLPTIESETPSIVEPEPAAVEHMEPELPPTPEVPAPAPEPEPTITFEERYQSSYSTLTDTQGRKIEAKLLSVTDTHAKIERKDGLVTTIPLNMLIQDDIAYCQYARAQLPVPTPTPSVMSSLSSESDLESDKLKAQGGIDWEAIFGSD
ncbi:MAG: hypothetical protein ACSHX8_13645 [Opitutaceae bacterium]